MIPIIAGQCPSRLIGMANAEALQPQIRVVLNWFRELQERVPLK